MKKKVLFSKISWLQTPQNGHFENKTIKTERFIKQHVSFSNNQKNIFKLDTRVFMVFFCLCAQETQSK